VKKRIKSKHQLCETRTAKNRQKVGIKETNLTASKLLNKNEECYTKISFII